MTTQEQIEEILNQVHLDGWAWVQLGSKTPKKSIEYATAKINKLLIEARTEGMRIAFGAVDEQIQAELGIETHFVERLNAKLQTNIKEERL